MVNAVGTLVSMVKQSTVSIHAASSSSFSPRPERASY
jgi:hypothetical protein